MNLLNFFSYIYMDEAHFYVKLLYTPNPNSYLIRAHYETHFKTIIYDTSLAQTEKRGTFFFRVFFPINFETVIFLPHEIRW